MSNNCARWLASISVLVTFSGCFLFPPYKPKLISAKRERVFIYQVSRNNETFGGIVERITGSRKSWRKILAINPKLNIVKMGVGSRIKFPVYFLKPNLRSKAKNITRSTKIVPSPSRLQPINKTSIQPPSILTKHSKPNLKIETASDNLEVMPLSTELETFEENLITDRVDINSVEEDTEQPTPQNNLPKEDGENQRKVILPQTKLGQPNIPIPTPESREDRLLKEYENLMQQIEQE